MLRASAVAEKAGFPSTSLVCEGFIGQASTTSAGLGLPNLPVSLVPGHTGAQSDSELRQNILSRPVDEVVRTLTEAPSEVAIENEPGPNDIVFSGSFEEVNRLFYENEWSAGLPIVPPSRDKIDAFLRFTNRAADETIGILLPDSRAATGTLARLGSGRRARSRLRPISPHVCRVFTAVAEVAPLLLLCRGNRRLA